MTTLKEVTRAVHDEAEHSEWGKLLVNGNITKAQYVHYLFNLLEIHQAIESRGVITKPEVLRVKTIINDIEATDSTISPVTLDSTWKYVDHLNKLPDDQLWGHIYCHYLGYMYGGQIIKKAVPFSTTMLDFDDRQGCVAYIREHLDGVDHEEAKAAFKWATVMFNDLWDHYKDEK
jgi:heme oxygenase